MIAEANFALRHFHVHGTKKGIIETAVPFGKYFYVVLCKGNRIKNLLR